MSYAKSRLYHEPTVSPGSGTNAPGQQPTIGTIGATLVASFTLNVDAAYRVFKIPSNFLGNPAVHVHWTKEPGVAGDGNENGNSVRWRISYGVWRSAPTGLNGDLNIVPTVIDLDDTYDDAGTTTRIAQRTANAALVGFVAGYYVGFCVEAVTPIGTPLTCEPALMSMDLTYDEIILSKS
jgi:hypothetical protein